MYAAVAKLRMKNLLAAAAKDVVAGEPSKRESKLRPLKL
jgi:hypothetical protein